MGTLSWHLDPTARHEPEAGTVEVVPCELVIFDCDGVLVDSEALVIEVEAAMLTEAGFPLTADDIAERFVGLSYRSMMTTLEAEFDRAVPEQLNQEIQAAALGTFPSALKPVPGIEQVLVDLERPRCVASSSDLDRINLSLSICDLTTQFEAEHIFSAQMVDRGKPAPDLFLFAADRLGADPNSCIVIEDSPAGVTAAAAAGMTVVGLVAGGHARPSLAGRLRAAGASEVFDTTALLGAYMAELS